MRGASLAWLLVSSLALGGCPTPTAVCSAGTHAEGVFCVPDDSGLVDAGGTDAPGLDAPELDAPLVPDAPFVGDAGPCGLSCEGTGTPFCRASDATCVECLANADCVAGGSGNETCLDGACVQCDGDEDCAFASASACNPTTHRCEACASSADCGHDGLGGICDPSGGTGTCVECTASDESACGANLCDVTARTCTSSPAGTLVTCQPCTSDRACAAGTACVAESAALSGGGTIEVGYFCLPLGPTCPPAGAPFVASATRPNRAGTMVDVCDLALTNCIGYEDGGAPCATDSECGVDGVDDGLCRTNPFDSMLRCTTPCAAASDCDSSSACSADTPRYCCFDVTCP